MEITKEIRGVKYKYDNDLFILVKQSHSAEQDLSPNTYFRNSSEEKGLEFAGTYMECKHEIMHIAALVSQGLYMDETVPGEDWYRGTGIYECLEKEGIRLVYSIYHDNFEHESDKYDIVKVENGWRLCVSLTEKRISL